MFDICLTYTGNAATGITLSSKISHYFIIKKQFTPKDSAASMLAKLTTYKY